MTVIFVVLLIAAFIGLDWVLHYRGKARTSPAAAAPRPVQVRIPDGVFFARSHTWLHLFPSGSAWLGVDDFVSRLLAHPRIRLLREPGTAVARGEALFALEEGGRTLTVRSPVDARILAVNHELDRRSAGLQEAPFGDNWVVELRPDRPADLKHMLLGEETRGWIGEEFRRLRDVLAGAGPELVPAVLQDGGPAVAGAMTSAAPEVWERFDKEFLEVR